MSDKTNTEDILKETQTDTIEDTASEDISHDDVKNADTEEETVFHEDNLEIRKMKFADRMKAKRNRLKENMEGMSGFEKFKYIVYYYKWHFILSALAIFLVIYVPLTIYKNTRPVALSYAIMNSTNYIKVNTDAMDDYMEYYGFKKGEYRLLGINSINLDLETYDEKYNDNDPSYTQFPINCYNNRYDVIITDYTGLKYCSKNALIHTLDTILTQDVEDIIETEYSHLIKEAPTYDDVMTPYAIDISDTDFAKSLNLGYDDVYLCFPGVEEENIMNAKRLINFIFNLELEI